MSRMLLVVGYAVALAVATRLVPVYRERRWRWLLALEAATLSVAAGHALEGRTVPAALNVGFVVAFGALWWWTGARRQPSAGAGSTR